MKQAMIVLTLWILSQKAYSQSTRLEEYSHSDAVCASAMHSGSMINRQAMADIDTHSLFAKTEIPASAAGHQKMRAAGAPDQAIQNDSRTLAAYAKALAENTRAIEENTKALRENTEMLRMLLVSGKYHYVGSFAAQQTREHRYESAEELSDQPAPLTRIFSGDHTQPDPPAPATYIKPHALLASLSVRPISAKIMASVIEPAKKLPPDNTNAKPNITAATQVKPGNQQMASVHILPTTSQKATAVSALAAKIAPKPRICFLFGSSDSPETESMPPIATEAAAMPRAWAASTAMKQHAPGARATVAATQMIETKAIVKKPIQHRTYPPTIVEPAASSTLLTANTAVKSHEHKTTKPNAAPIDLAAMCKTPKRTNSAMIPTPVNAASKPQLTKTIRPTGGSAIPVAGSMMKMPKSISLAINPIPSNDVVGAKSAINVKVKPHLHANVEVIPPEHKSLVVNSIPANAAQPKLPVARVPIEPQTSNISKTLVTAKPAKTNIRTKPMLASMAPVIITASKPSVANHTIEGKTPTLTITIAAKPTPVATETGMATAKSKKVSLGYMLQFPLLARPYDNQMRVENHIPTDVYSGFKEGDVVTTHGYISLIAVEDSGKENETYYIQLVTNPYRKDSCLNVRIAADQFAGDERRKLTETAGQFLRDELLNGRAPSHSGNVMQSPVFVCITGQLVYNSALAGAMRGPRPLYIGKKGVRSYTPWEISNVNRLQFMR